MTELAETIVDVAGSRFSIVYEPRPVDDPQVRRPDTTLAERELGWQAGLPLRDGLERTVEWFRDRVRAGT